MSNTKLLGHGKKKTVSSHKTTNWLLVTLTLYRNGFKEIQTYLKIMTASSKNNSEKISLRKWIIELKTMKKALHSPSRCHYPKSKKTKVRIVCDATAKAKKGCKSLEECLCRGPVILEDLCRLLLRFRIYKVVLTADIENAFLQVGLQPVDRGVSRLLWLKDPTKPLTKDNLKIYRFIRTPFGVISSLFLLGATIFHRVEQARTPAAEKIMKIMYVDNLLTGVN